MPHSHRAHREWSPGRFLNWAQDIGPCTRQVVQQQLENRPHPEHGYRACLGLLNLSRRYNKARLEKACERALAIRSINYQSIKPANTCTPCASPACCKPWRSSWASPPWRN